VAGNDRKLLDPTQKEKTWSTKEYAINLVLPGVQNVGLEKRTGPFEDGKV